MTSILTADKWIYSTLKNDSTLTALITGVYIDNAPDTANYPFVTFSQVTSAPLRVVGATVVWYDELWQVAAHAVGQDYAGCKSIVDRVRALLDKKTGSNTDGVVAQSIENSSFRFSNTENGIAIKTLGLEFAIKTQ